MFAICLILAWEAIRLNGPMLWSQRIMGRNAELSASSAPLGAQPCHKQSRIHVYNKGPNQLKVPYFLSGGNVFSRTGSKGKNLSNRASDSSENQTGVLFLPHCIQKKLAWHNTPRLLILDKHLTLNKCI